MGSWRDMESHVAGPEEVRQAIKSLTKAELVRLNHYAQNRLARLGALSWAYTGDDLLQEAMLSMLEEGRRYWRPEVVSLSDFLRGTMRSISSNWARKSVSDGPAVPASHVARPSDEGDHPVNFFDTVAAPGPNPEAELLNNEYQTPEQLVIEIEKLVKDELIPSVVLDEMKVGKKGPEIMKALGITEKELRAAQLMIYRRARARWPGGMPHVR